MVSILKFPHYLGLGTNAYDLILAVLNPPPLPILSLFLSFSFCEVASRSDLFYFFRCFAASRSYICAKPLLCLLYLYIYWTSGLDLECFWLPL